MVEHGSRLCVLSQELRKNATREENHLWYDFLKDHPLQFRRQKVLGGYIVDFFCAEAGLVVEIDGGQHYGETGLIQRDQERTAYLEKIRGFSVLRFTNLEIAKNFEGVCAAIQQRLTELAPSSGAARHLPPKGKAKGS